VSSGTHQVGVLGGGLMGTGIAESVARAGHQVRLFEPLQGSRSTSRARLEASVARGAKAGKLAPDEAKSVLERVRYVERLADLGASDLVIEAVVEDRDVKLDYFRRLDDCVREDAVLASNTSSIPIAGLASAVSHPDRVLGLHFFSPAPVMSLVEVVSALGTSLEAIERAEAFVLSLGKTPIATKDRSGFIVNMLLIPYLVAAVRMLEDGFATREDIDAGMKLGCGHPMGPLVLCDFIGLDVLYAICDSLYDEFKRPEYAPPPLLKRMLATGWLGKKSGRGFYDYAGAGLREGSGQLRLSAAGANT
jgi:3-hydroxybutyryl-CoA dehydrogenase